LLIFCYADVFVISSNVIKFWALTICFYVIIGSIFFLEILFNRFFFFIFYTLYFCSMIDFVWCFCFVYKIKKKRKKKDVGYILYGELL